MTEKRTISQAMNLLELEEVVGENVARRGDAGRLQQSHYDYYRGGACDEITLKQNCSDFSRLKIWPRMLVDVSKRDMSLDIFGATIDMPILVAPTAFQALAHSDGEKATAAAAKKLNTVMTLSTLSNFNIEEVAAAGHHMWYQLYVYKNRDITRSLIARAEACNYKALVVTVDSPLLGRRERDVRNSFCLPADLSAANLKDFALADLSTTMAREMQDNLGADNGNSRLAAYIASLYDTSLTWKDLEWIISITRLPTLVKGILRADDTRRALDCGASGIIVSNHGGRQLDTTTSTINALPAIAAVVKEWRQNSGSAKNSALLLDGGIRRGTDVLKALALGADAVMLGRPVLWGLALAGEQGVIDAMRMLKEEFDLAMALSGCASLKDISADLVSL
jgi:4-hydroxymandelate oxidase